MCEIAVCDPEQCGISAMHQIAAKFHEEQGDGIGVLAVKNHGDSFSYEVYRSAEPHWQTLFAFMKRHLDETWRFVIHGRYGTIGGVKREHCHPLEVDCERCSFDYVIHNGSVRNYQENKASLISAGHDFETEVDSEVIPHKIEELPDTVSDHSYNTYNISGKLNFLVFSEDGILVRAQRKYDVTDDFTMTCSRTDFDNAEELGFEHARNKWALITPDGTTPEIETKERTYKRSGNSNSSRSTGSSRSTQQTWPRTQSGASQDDDEQVVVAYDDLTPDYENISVVKVAPGVLRMRDDNVDEVEYIKRDHEPRLYFHYAPEETPDNIDTLEELAEARPVENSDQESIMDYADEPQGDEGNASAEEKAAAHAAATTIAHIAEGDIPELQRQIEEAMAVGQERAEATGD